LFDTGSPLNPNLRSLLHCNINVSDFEVSKSFYQMLGIRVLEAAGIEFYTSEAIVPSGLLSILR
jgi:hypothetical protein